MATPPLNSPQALEGPIALVTGGSRGIGRAICQALAAKGYRVAIHYRRDSALASALAQSLPASASPKCFGADLAHPDSCLELISEVKEEYGHLDILVNNAGKTADQLLPLAKPSAFEDIIATNLRSVFLLTKAASRLMMRQRSGSIINITSVVGHTGNIGQSLYAATKGALAAFSRSVAIELAPFQIRVNCVAPGFISTEMTDKIGDAHRSKLLERIPLGRLGSPDEIAGVVAFLASPEASYITGSTIHVNGGLYTS